MSTKNQTTNESFKLPVMDREQLQRESKDTLIEIIFSLIARITKLEESLAKLSRNSATSSKPPSSDITKPRPAGDSGERKQGAQAGHNGTTRTPFGEDEIDEVKELKIEECPHCHSQDVVLDAAKETRKQQQAELIEDPVWITEYLQPAYVCLECGHTLFASLPSGVLDNQLFGPRLQSLIGYMKGMQHCSYTTIQDFFQDILRLPVSRGMLCDLISRLNETIKVPYEALKEHLTKEPYLHIDESGWKNNGIAHWAWVFATRRISFFTIEASRGSAVLNEVLGPTFKGCLISDFFSAYVKYASPRQQFCLAHLIRDIKFLLTLPQCRERDFGKILLRQFKLIFYLWHRRETLSGKKYQAYMKRIITKIKTLLEAEDIPVQGLKLARRLHKHWAAIFRFVFHSGLEPTNNIAEQAIRSLVIDRKITQGSRSAMGLQWNARIWTVLSTCKKQKKSAWKFLESCVNAYYFGSPFPSLIPEN